MVLPYEGKLNADINAAECLSRSRSNCVEIHMDERTDSGRVLGKKKKKNENGKKKLKLSVARAKEFHSRFSEEKYPPNKRTGMRGDVRSIRMFNQEGRFFSFAGGRRRKGHAVGRSGIVTLWLKSQQPIGLFTGQPIRSWLLRFNTYS